MGRPRSEGKNMPSQITPPVLIEITRGPRVESCSPGPHRGGGRRREPAPSPGRRRGLGLHALPGQALSGPGRPHQRRRRGLRVRGRGVGLVFRVAVRPGLPGGIGHQNSGADRPHRRGPPMRGPSPPAPPHGPGPGEGRPETHAAAQHLHRQAHRHAGPVRPPRLAHR